MVAYNPEFLQRVPYSTSSLVYINFILDKVEVYIEVYTVLVYTSHIRLAKSRFLARVANIYTGGLGTQIRATQA